MTAASTARSNRPQVSDGDSMPTDSLDDMCPQPLSRVNPNARYSFTKDGIGAYPNLCARAMEIIHLHSIVEHRWSLILVEVLRADPKTGMAMYQALSSSEARRAALLAAAYAVLTQEDAFLFHACLEAGTPIRRVRNHFAHHLWGTSEDIPDAILLANPATFLQRDVIFAAANKAMRETGRVVVPKDEAQPDIQVWRASDLATAVGSADEYLRTVRELETGIYVFGIPLNAETRRLLLGRPQVESALRRLRKQNDPEAPPAPRAEAPPQ